MLTYREGIPDRVLPTSSVAPPPPIRPANAAPRAAYRVGMPPAPPPPDDLEALLLHADWLRRLATCLVHDGAEADDLVQETWMAALRSPPEAGRPPRPWLARVVRNVVLMRQRSAGRRHAREREVPAAGMAAGTVNAGTVSADVVLERLELQRVVVALANELEEPFRTAVVLRFFEGREPAEIARREGIPAGTVRWRVSEGLRRLRLRLDEAHGGRREAWRALVLPLTVASPPAAAPGPGARARPGVGGGGSGAAIGAGVLALGLVVVALWKGAGPWRAPDPARDRVASARVAPSAAPTTQRPEAEPMTMKKPTTKAAALFGVVLPALVASAEGAKPLPRAEAIAFCIEQREWIVQKCRDEFADLLVERVPAEQREAARAKWLKEITEGGTGPLEPRQQKCAAELDKKAQLASISTYAARDAIRACQREPDCKVALPCGLQVMFGQGPKPH